METPREITFLQAAAVLISTIIGVGVLSLPVIAVKAVDTGAPLLTFIGTMIALFSLGILAALGKRFPRKSIIHYSEDILGVWIGRIGSVAIIFFFAVLSALTAREFGEVVVTAVLRNTPLEVTVIVMLALAAISCRNDLSTFSYIHLFYLPFILAPGLLIVALSLQNAELINLQPIAPIHKGQWFYGSLTIAALFQGSFIVTMIIPSMRHPAKTSIACVLAIIVSGGLYLLIVIASVAIFGAEETKMLIWPTLELARMTSLPANVLERLDILFLAVWVTGVFTTLFSTYYFTIHSLSNLLRLRDHKMFSLFLLPVIFVLAMVPQNVMDTYRFILTIGLCGLIITIGYPAVLLIIAILRKKREDQHDREHAQKTP
ncbi:MULTISPECIES: GerAB/ArcD/ProY family transporter [Brevibacillus]|jgi:spore germination protein|uniref:Spore germination protein n=1 Tax=Brevibacillus borstelensis AK1 TaxID=1300222 RepID=M8DKZ3_9BACL|nr:endospore germination permease [Brevibacillus borstelensis]EMT54127.1 spore germination protein [Brevibacillus borstelensis AK1]KKX53954.1 spore gernimation protein [Brevibacillus borstelensis cifa_chp40]MCM3589187.1 spore germination protein [Brevibacillus borstelensis]MCM3621059.1 spore germination protein [Brevibacillus borstelensis]MED1746426.1 endospore germination permease [Brevibacillus borstelensis]